MEEVVDLRRYIRLLGKHLWLIGSLALIAALVAFLASAASSPPVYEATASVLISQSYSQITFDPRFQTVDSADTMARTYALNQQSHRAGLVALVRSGHVAGAVLEKLGDESLRPVELLSMVSAKIGGTGTTATASSDVIDIMVRFGDPAMAAQIANLWAESYVAHVNALYSSRPESYTSVQQQSVTARQVYLDAEEVLLAFLAVARGDELASLVDEAQHRIDELLQDRQDAIAENYAEKRRLERLVRDASALLAQAKSGGQESAATSYLSLVLLKAQAFASSTRLPGQLQVQVELADGPASEASALLADVEALIASLEYRVAELDETIQQALAEPIPEAVADLHDRKRALSVEWEEEDAKQKELVRARDLAWETYSTLQVKVVELGIATETADVEVVFASPAVEPLKPVGRSHLLTAGVAGACGMVAAVLLVLLMDFVSPDVDVAKRIAQLWKRQQDEA